MPIRDIMLFLRAGDASNPALSVAAFLAQRHGAFLHARCLVDDPEPELADCYAIGPAAVSDVIMRLDQAVATAVKASHDAFLKALGMEVLFAWSVSSPDEDVARAARHARLADLAILGHSQRSQGADRALAEALALRSGAACLVIPEGCSAPARFDRIVVGWNGSAEAKRAITDSLDLLKDASTVEVVTVGDLSADRQEHDSEAVVAHLARHGVSAHAQQVQYQTDAGAALLQFCETLGASLLVMGA